MILKKKWLAIFTTITVVLLLGACGGNKESKQIAGANYDNPRNHTAEDFMAISEGFEKYPVWIQTAENPVRDSKVSNVFVFKKGRVTAYKLEDTTIEDIHDLSNDELVKLASESTNKNLDKLADEINNTSISEWVKEEKDGSFKDIYLKFDGGKRSALSSKYTLDITLDELGQNTQKINLNIPKAYYQLSNPGLTDYDASGFNASGFKGTFFEYYTYTTDPNYQHEPQNYSRSLKILEKHGSFKDSSTPPQPQTYVPDPIVWKTTSEQITLSGGSVKQTILGTTFSGIIAESGSLLTRVNDSFVGFKLDGPDTKKKNVTIEGK